MPLDHRKIGAEQELFYFHETAPGSAFFLPHGTRILSRLQTLLRGHYLRRGYEEVVTPIMFHKQLWQQSGHWDFYQQNMFEVRAPSHQQPASQDPNHTQDTNNAHDTSRLHFSASEEEAMQLKPMNCPSHCLIYRARPRSHRELPLRLADFGMLHRNELAGALTGLTRVRRFQQDDAHIFCAEEQMQREIEDCLDMMQRVYGLLGFSHSFVLSTRPQERMGSEEQWDRAEAALVAALRSKQLPHALNPGDGAFYGPKIDVQVLDNAGKTHQLATIQLDFQLPRRFGLAFAGADGREQTPVIVHRAVLGSLERALALLLETNGGRWPFWLSPRQVVVLPVSQGQTAYAQRVKGLLSAEGFYAELDDDPVTLQRRIRRAQGLRFNFMLVLGEREEQGATVSIRGSRDLSSESPQGAASQTMPLSELVNFFKSQLPSFE